MENNTPAQSRVSRWFISIVRLCLTVALPIFLVLTSVRLVMSEAFLQIEYHRPGFPADRYGFTQKDRLTYAPYAVQYLLNDAGIDYLGDLTIAGEPMFTARELKHMEDVKVVTRIAFRVQLLLTLGMAAVVIFLAWRPQTRQTLRQGLFEGGLLTIAAIITLVVLVIAGWNTFFTGFHQLFFEGDSWQFSTRDTLIRLFPEQFWFDAALCIGLLTVTGALSAVAMAWLWERRQPNEEKEIVPSTE